MRKLTRPSGPRRDDDRGVVMILIALTMVALLVMVALVIDYGFVRHTRQDSRLTADVATTAGLQALAPDGRPRPWQGVCAALDYLEANRPELTLTTTFLRGDGSPALDSSGSPAAPCTAAPFLEQECVPGDETTWAWIQAVDGSFVADIKSGYVLPDPAFAEDANEYTGDVGSTDQGGCDQIAVIVGATDGVVFGGVIGADDYDTVGRSVGRVKIDSVSEGVPAFLMLERKTCNVLSQQVGVGGGEGIIVEPATPTDPGIIHVDSSGSASTGCNGNNNAGGWAVYSADIDRNPGIIAKPALDGTPGIIGIHALEVGLPPNNYGGSKVPPEIGLSPTPTPAGIVSRAPVDEKYNSPDEPTITNIHASAYVDATRSSAPSVALGALGEPVSGAWTTLTCANNDGPFVDTKIFVNCPGGYSPRNVTFSAATDVIFNGPVHVEGGGGGRSLFMPAAERVVVGGTTTRGLEVANNGRFGTNSLSFLTGNASTACTGREGPAWPQTTKLVIFGGSSTAGALNIAGEAALCQTFVYLAGPKAGANSTYSRQEIVDGSYDPTCDANKPCPKGSPANTITNAQVVVSGHLQWSAPNQLMTQPAPGSVGVEDLALWTETAAKSEVKAGGVLEAFGVYFLPNARAEMRSPALAVPRDAQFIARSLLLLQGTLRMKPTPGNAVQIPILAGQGLVR